MATYALGDCIWEDIGLETSDGTDVVFDSNWTGAWVMKAVGSATILAVGSMPLRSDNLAFELRVDPGITTAFAAGKYVITAQLTNAVIKFKREKKSFVTLEAQSSVP